MSSINDYYEALQRLVEGKPKIVPLESNINNDTVALEAGRTRGSIKKSRANHEKLINDIRLAEQGLLIEKDCDVKHEADRERVVFLKSMLDESLEREISLLFENFNLHQEILKLKERRK
ncbi:hypothetical protein [Aeromonas popoffii]|uniref:hypothetical protein n=1 Tax=Aeromonas popoffii TaxID=70856 RepID=UPI0009FD8585|nr:hypothetical protein [Aeromonas popoffii]